MSVIRRSLGSLAVALALSALPIAAGQIQLAWDPVTTNEDGTACTDLAGYRVYWGSAPANYSNSVDVGNVTQYTVTNLPDCQNTYLAVKAYDTAGNLSTNYSNEVFGYPRPIVTTSNPSSAEQGRTLSIVISGNNYQAGATVQFGAPGIVVNSVTFDSCGQLTANVTVGATAAIGATNVDVTNPDQVFGSGANVFTVLAAAAPTVVSTSPADGATGVSIDVRPTVTFSESMLPGSVNSSTVQILDASGNPIAQAAGSPSLSTNGIVASITPASSLMSGRTYKIRVIGGSGGVLDLAGHPMASTFTQATGFSTGADSAGPVISGVQSANTTSSTTRITWTTDEASDSQVFYRKVGQTGYQQTSVNAALVTSHSVDLQGLEPATSYEYHVRSADSAANASESSPDQSFTTNTSTYTYIRMEAEAGDLTGAVRIAGGGGAFAGNWIDTPLGASAGTASSPSGTATFGVNIATAGSYYLWVRVFGPDVASDAWFESVDGAARQPIVASPAGTWTWVAARSYTLTVGLHSIELGGYEAQTRADRLLLTNDPNFRPSEQPVDDQAPPAAPTPFNASPSRGQNSLSWTNPRDADYATTTVRYRTDGRYPTSPADGFAVTQRSTAPGQSDSYVHNGLTNGTTYYYSAFATDGSDNVSVVSRTEGTPADGPPGVVKNARRKDKKP